MIKLLVVHNDDYFSDFLRKYLKRHDFDVMSVKKPDEALKIASKETPNLIIINKDQSNVNIKQIIQKKKKQDEIASVPLFLIGKPTNEDIEISKKEMIEGFIETPVNPETLLERLNLFFQKEDKNFPVKTPMLLDIHVKGKIIIVQIEANLEPDKLEILNFEIRNICKQKKYKSPKILFIIPSLYPETITDENLKLLFDFKNYKELKIESQNIKILSQCDSLLEVVQANDEYKHFEIVSNLIDGVQKLNQDLTSKKTIKISKLTIDSSFIYDLYDKKGNIIIPSFTKITQDILGYLQENKIKNLVYYSEENLEDIIKEQQKPHVINKELEKVISTFEPVSEDIDMIKSLNDKIKLFFKKLKKYSVLVISTNSNNNKIIYNALNPYLNIIFLDNLDTINNLEGGKFISIFLDSSLSDPSAINLLKKIKMNNSLENTNIIITAEELTTDMLFELKKEGSDNILYSPLSKSKILAKVFESISSDLV